LLPVHAGTVGGGGTGAGVVTRGVVGVGVGVGPGPGVGVWVPVALGFVDARGVDPVELPEAVPDGERVVPLGVANPPDTPPELPLETVVFGSADDAKPAAPGSSPGGAAMTLPAVST